VTGSLGPTGATGDPGPTGATGPGQLECFVAGALLTTPEGERAVEDLVVGDLVLTIDGDAVPIRWIGRRTLHLDRHPRPSEVRPVRILAHAFGDNLPRRDLLLSPGHGLYFRDAVGEHLIPAFYLVNGRTIIQEVVATVDYVHIELDRHDILLVEGLAAESYLDVGNRAEFENADGAIVLYPAFAALAHEAARAPFVIAGPTLGAVRASLEKRADVMAASLSLRSRRRAG
jgi:collagen type I alpha